MPKIDDRQGVRAIGSESLIIIEDRNQVERLISLAKKGEQKRSDIKPTVVALSEDVCRELAARGLKFKTLADYGLSNESIEDEGVNWFRRWPDAKIKDSKNIKEAILYGDISLWWLVDDVLYWDSFVFPSLKKVVNQATILSHIVSAEEPSVIYYARNNTPASGVLKLICKSRNIPAITIPGSPRLKRRISQRLRAMVYIFGPWLRTFARKIGWAVLGRSSKLKRPREGEILIFSGENWGNTYNLATGGLRKGDPYFDSVIELLKDKWDIALISIPGTFNWGIRTFREKNRQQDARYRPFEYYLNRKIIIKAWRGAKRLHQEYQSLASGEGLKHSLKLYNLPLYELIKQNLSLAFSKRHLTMVITIFEIAKRIMEVEKPGAVIVCGEFTIFERAIIVAAKLKGIPVLSVQHGAYSPYFIHYNYLEGDIGPNREATAPYCPVADKFAVYSQQDKDNFVHRGRIRESDVIISGQPRYDILARADKVFNRRETFKRLNLDPEKKLVVWMTQSHSYTTQQNERYINIVYTAASGLEDVQLVVKLHPAEDPKATLYRKGKQFQPKIIGGWGTLTFELLHASDIVITHCCSTAIEAIILNTPVIVLVPTSVPHYIESGAAIAIQRAEELKTAIERILYDKDTQQSIAKAQRNYIRESDCLQSGRASQIVADLVMQMAEESKQEKYQ